jgi:hypothetical protein
LVGCLLSARLHSLLPPCLRPVAVTESETIMRFLFLSSRCNSQKQ